MVQQASVPRLHMGCGEPLRSQWLLSVVRTPCKPEAVARTLESERRKRERAHE